MTGRGNLAVRLVAAEVLDALPVGDPRAKKSRRDLKRINAVMFQPAVMARLLARHVPTAPRRMLEIGAGDAAFSLAVARRLAPRWGAVELTLLDCADIVSDETLRAFEKLGWQAQRLVGDAFEALAGFAPQTFDLVTANLFLHHFGDAELLRLFSSLRACGKVLAATETRRDFFSLGSARMVWALGANDVTRHDAPASVRAGFRDGELSGIWRAAGGNAIAERRAGFFTHAFVGRSEALL